jgi:hypothetical protein
VSLLLGEDLAHRAVRLAWTTAVGGQTVTPVIRLSIEVVEIRKIASGEEGASDVANASFDATFFVAACYRDRAGLVAVVPGKAEQRGMEADRITAPLQHRTFKIVIE